MVKCYVCKFIEVDKKPGEWRSACERCAELLKAPPCKACGQPVRDAQKNDPHPYHEECRRCSSCNQKVSRQGMHFTAGKILCSSCDDLFGEFFAPGKRSGSEYMQEAFKAWDEDKSGFIDTGELRLVLKAIMPNFSDRDLNDLLRVIDTNGNGVVEYEEFCQWLTKENPLEFSQTTFSHYVAQLMREAGKAREKADLCVDEIQVREDGVYFRLRSGTVRLETTAFRNESGLSLTALDPEEFISKVECVEDGLHISFNTGRVITLDGKGELFGPFEAPKGFYIDGLRTKPVDKGNVKDYVAGIEAAPLPSASEYDCPCALLYTAEQEYLRSLREILAKAAVDVNGFGYGGATALMLAASRGCTGSMRLLLSSKANVNLADSDGWTALTYASRCGSPEAVQALLVKGAKEGEGDGGRALKEALRKSHNSAARALLRAGFGPAPVGTFALEGQPKPEDCKLEAPAISPSGGAFSQAKQICLLVGGNDAAKLPQNMKVLYTLDGRDPFLAGQRYIGPFTISNSRVQIRAVAVQAQKRSPAVEATFLICHTALPDEIVFGTLRAQLFPASMDFMLKFTAEALNLPVERLQARMTEADGASTKRWIQVDLNDLKPRHQIRFDLAYATVKSADKRKKWIESIKSDISKAVGEEPADCKVFAGSIILEFQMSREKADELVKHLQDPNSWLLTKGKHRKAFKTASLQVVEALGARLTTIAFRDEVEKGIKSKQRCRVVAIGKGDKGAVAKLVADKKEAKWMKKQLDSVVRKILEDVEFAEVQDYPEFVDLEFSVDIMEPGKGREIVEILREPETSMKIADTIAIMKGIDTKVSVVAPAASRKLAEMEVVIQWTRRNGSKSEFEEQPNCNLVVYAEEHMVYSCDIGSATSPKAADVQKKDNLYKEEMSKSVGRAVGSWTQENGNESRLQLDLSALPSDVTEMYFVISAEESYDLSSFSSASFSLVDLARNQELSSYECNLGASQGFIICSLSRFENGWVVLGVGEPSDETVSVLADRQSRHLNWERRRDLVKLRVLYKCQRMSRCSDADFALLMQFIMELPVAVFQSLAKFV